MNPLDKYFKDQLGNAQKQNPHHLWDAIEKQLDEPSSARRMGWLGWSSAGLFSLALLLGGAYVWNQSYRSSDTSQAPSSISDLEASKGARGRDQMSAVQNFVVDANGEAHATDDGSNILSYASSNWIKKEDTYSISDVSSTNILKTAETQFNQNATNQNSQSEVMDNNTGDRDPKKVPSKQNLVIGAAKSSGDINGEADIVEFANASKVIEAQTVPSSSKRSTDANTLSKGIVQNQNSITQQAGIVALESQQSGLSNNQGEIKQGIPHNKKDITWTIEVSDNVTVNTVPSKLMKSEETFRARDIERSVLPIMNIMQMSLEGSEQNRIDAIEADLAPVAYTQCPTFSNNDRTGLYFDALVSHDLPLSRLSTSNSGFQGEVDMRAMSEAMQYSNAFGGRLSLTLPNGLTFRTGLQYTVMRQQVTFVDEGTNEQTIDNRYSFFDIPFLLGKEFGQNGSRWYFAANGGILLNVLQSQDGSVRTTGMQLLDFDNLTAEGRSGYEDSAGLAGYASFAIYYRWLQAADLFIEPNVRYGFGSLTKQAYGIDHNFTTVGVATGLRYRF